jgi:hypothetical protein
VDFGSYAAGRRYLHSVALEILNCAFMSLGFLFRGERTEIAPFARPGILLSRVQAIFSGFQFADHTS